jgi:hypothetical protein
MEIDSNDTTSPHSTNENSFGFLSTFDFNNTGPGGLDSIIISEDNSSEGTPFEHPRPEIISTAATTV